jgi:hypothetical protein
MPTDNAMQPGEEQIQEEIEDILTDIVAAQGNAAATNPKAIVQHLQEVTYPLLARVATFTKRLNDSFEDAASAFGGAEDTMSKANSDFLNGYIDIVFAFVQKYIPGAQQSAATGDDELLTELRGLYEGGKAMKRILSEMVVQEDEPDDGSDDPEEA